MGKAKLRVDSALAVEAWPLDRPTPYQNNPRRITEAAITKVAASLKRYGWRQPIVVCAKEEIVVGHTRRLAAMRIHEAREVIPNWPDTSLIPVHASGMDEAAAKAYRLADNRTGEEAEWDLDLLTGEFAALDDFSFPLDLTGFDEDEYRPVDAEQRRKGALEAVFGAPPFSVLSSRSGWWRRRKEAWLSLGMQSELGRTATFEAMGKLFAKAEGLAQAPAWSSTSIFDPVLCELAYRWFSPPGGMVLDPFAGGSVRGLVASHLGREYTGVELRAEQVAANEAQRDLAGPGAIRWIEGDSQNIGSLTDGCEADMVFSCPPYADLEVYSDDPRDLSNMDYTEFVEAYRKIIVASCSQLRQDRFACFVVGEVRGKGGGYRNFVQDTVKAFCDAGLIFYNEAVLLTPVGTLAMRARKPFETSRKLGKAHQSVLIFCKGDPKRAAVACGPVELADPEPDDEGDD